MARRGAALALLLLLALLGGVGLAERARAWTPQGCCALGRACPMRSARAASSCPTGPTLSVELGCCAPAPAAPAPAAPLLAAPAEADVATAAATETAHLALPGSAHEALEALPRARAEQLHELGLFTLHSIYRI